MITEKQGLLIGLFLIAIGFIGGCYYNKPKEDVGKLHDQIIQLNEDAVNHEAEAYQWTNKEDSLKSRIDSFEKAAPRIVVKYTTLKDNLDTMSDRALLALATVFLKGNITKDSGGGQVNKVGIFDIDSMAEANGECIEQYMNCMGENAVLKDKCNACDSAKEETNKALADMKMVAKKANNELDQKDNKIFWIKVERDAIAIGAGIMLIGHFLFHSF